MYSHTFHIVSLKDQSENTCSAKALNTKEKYKRNVATVFPFTGERSRKNSAGLTFLFGEELSAYMIFRSFGSGERKRSQRVDDVRAASLLQPQLSEETITA